MSIQIFTNDSILLQNRLIQKYSIKANEFFENKYSMEIRNESLNFFENNNALLKSDKVFYRKDIKGNDSLFLFNNEKELNDSINLFKNDTMLRISSAITNFFKYENISNNVVDRLNLDSETKCFNIGILNVTPDSFSDGGECIDIYSALTKCEKLLKNGANIIDVGGESSRPGAKQVTVEEEENRVLPVIEYLLKKYPNIIISVDTVKSSVAEKSLKLGAKIINDISGFSNDSEMLQVIAKYKPPVILMHTQGTPDNMQNSPYYIDVVSEIYDYFIDKIKILNSLGIDDIIIDPGIGFGKRVSDNLEIIKRLKDFKSLGYPILIGLSRKSFLGEITKSHVNDREVETISMETISIINGARFIRTHNTRNLTKINLLMNKYFDNGIVNV